MVTTKDRPCQGEKRLRGARHVVVVAACSLLPALVAASAGCQLTAAFEPFEPREARDAALASAPERFSGCARLPPSKLRDKNAVGGAVLGFRLHLVRPPGAPCFWVDETEVTVGRYRAFLTSLPSRSLDGERIPRVFKDTARCAWKRFFSDPDRPSEESEVPCDPGVAATGDAVRCVDWCDAREMCQLLGMDLCGASNTEGPLDPPSWGDPWGSACAAGGAPRDLRINVSEWALGCAPAPGGDASKHLACAFREGTFGSDANCSAQGYEALSSRLPTRGFRCCAPLTHEEAAIVQ